MKTWQGLSLALAALGPCGAAHADVPPPPPQPPAEDAAASRSATFQAVEGASAEDVPGGPLLVSAYAVVLVLLVGYVVWLARLQAGTARELARLRAAVERAPEARGPSAE